MIRPLVLLAAAFAPLGAAPIIPPVELFRDPQFVREFVGSYGFLSDVEPKVSADEQAALTAIRGMFEQKRFREAEQELARFMRETEHPTDPKKKPAEVSPAMIFVMGNLYFQADRPDEARRAFLDAIKRFPRFRRAHTNLAFLYISKNQTDEAMPMLQKAIELGENSARVYGLLGYCHLLKRDPVAAENAYRQANLLDSGSRDWKLGLAQALMAQEKNAEAASLIGTLIEANPNDRQLWLQQTNAFLAMDRKEEAIVNLEALRLKGIADEANLNLLGNLHMDRGEPQLALLAYQAAMDRSKTLDLARALKSARILNDYGYPDNAAALLEKIHSKAGNALSPRDRTALLLTEVRVAQTRKDSQATGRLLESLLAADPANAEVLLETGRHKDALARDEADPDKRGALVAEARTNYQLAARQESVAYPAKLALGQLLVRERRYSEALTHLQAALALRKSESLEQYVSRVRRAADRADDRKKSES